MLTKRKALVLAILCKEKMKPNRAKRLGDRSNRLGGSRKKEIIAIATPTPDPSKLKQ
jgi:hypothetical protein